MNNSPGFFYGLTPTTIHHNHCRVLLRASQFARPQSPAGPEMFSRHWTAPQASMKADGRDSAGGASQICSGQFCTRAAQMLRKKGQAEGRKQGYKGRPVRGLLMQKVHEV